MLMVLVTLLFLWLANDALAFYNPSTGKWLSRDPIWELGDYNLQSYAYNNPLSYVDTDGRWIVPAVIIAGECGWLGQQLINNSVQDPSVNLGDGNRWYPPLPLPGKNSSLLPHRNRSTFTVRKCQIVIVYGHGSYTVPFKWVFEPGSCSAGGAVTCFPGVNAPARNGLATQCQSHAQGMWNLPPGGILRDRANLNEIDSDIGTTLDLNRELERMLADIPSKVREICRSRCCKTIDVFFERNANPDPKKDKEFPRLPLKRTYQCN